MSSTASRNFWRLVHCMPAVISASSASRDAGSAEMSTVPPRVRAHSARSSTGAVTTTVGCPAFARAALGAASPVGTVHDPTVDEPPVHRYRTRRVRRHCRRGTWRPGHPPPHHIDGVVDGARRDIDGDRTDRHARRQLGVDAVHRGLMGLHPPGEADGLVGRPPRPARLGVVAAGELAQQRGRRFRAERDHIG